MGPSNPFTYDSFHSPGYLLAIFRTIASSEEYKWHYSVTSPPLVKWLKKILNPTLMAGTGGCVHARKYGNTFKVDSAT